MDRFKDCIDVVYWASKKDLHSSMDRFKVKIYHSLYHHYVYLHSSMDRFKGIYRKIL